MLTVMKDKFSTSAEAGRGFAADSFTTASETPPSRGADRLCQREQRVRHRLREAEAHKGNIIPAGTTSPYSLYSENLVTFGESDDDQNQAAGFINLWGLPTKVQALREQGKL